VNWFVVLFISLAAILGLCVFGLMAIVLIWQGEAESKYQKLQETVTVRQMQRTAEKVKVLYAIREMREDQRGPLWEKYHVLDNRDQALTRQECSDLADVRGIL